MMLFALIFLIGGVSSESLHGCEGDTLTISCPEGSAITILKANYGRLSRQICPNGPIKTQSCSAPNSLSIVKESCEGKNECQLQASNGVFGDPCGGTVKYLEVEYECGGGGGGNYEVACERNALELSCPEGTKIGVLSANYGRTSNEPCSSGPIRTTECVSPQSLTLVKKSCSGQSQCKLSASNSVFGDPCPGTTKYLAVNYHCLRNGVPVAPSKPTQSQGGIKPGSGIKPGGGIKPGKPGGGGAVRPTGAPPAPTPKPPAACTKSQTVVGGKNQCSGQVLFQDNFNSGFSSDKWSHSVLMPWIPDYEFVTFTKSSENSYVADGCFNIKPTMKTENEVLNGNVDLRDCTGELYSEECKRQAVSFNIIPPVNSARIHTKDTFSFRYGIVEIRAKLPSGDWIVPELWLEPVRQTYGPDYTSGRIRIAMARGNKQLSAPDGSDLGNRRLECGVLAGVNEEIRELSVTREDPEGWYKDFHNYTLIWRPNNLIYMVDGQLRQNLIPEGDHRMCDLMGFTGESADTWKAGSALAPCDKDFYVSIGLSVGGVRDFPDSVESGPNPKPWHNYEVKAMAKFWKAKDKWLPTWDDDSVLQIDSVRVRAL